MWIRFKYTNKHAERNWRLLKLNWIRPRLICLNLITSKQLSLFIIFHSITYYVQALKTQGQQPHKNRLIFGVKSQTSRNVYKDVISTKILSVMQKLLMKSMKSFKFDLKAYDCVVKEFIDLTSRNTTKCCLKMLRFRPCFFWNANRQ